MEYDPAGNQNKLVDKSAGTISYTYNGFGELISQVNPGTKTTTINYNDNGTINNKMTPEGTTSYVYNSNKQLIFMSSPGSMGDSIWYDAKGRILKSTKFINGSAFRTTLTYDSKGRVSTVKHPSGIVETKNYNTNGYLNSVSTGGIVRWLTTSVNARQQVTAGKYWKSGGNITATFGYDAYGFPNLTTAGTIQNYSYNFDPVTGNLTWRKNNKYTLTENFTYDNLDRLSTASKGATQTLNMGYDANKGGITTKSDVGTLLYGNSSLPYAVSSINPKTNLTPSAAQDITYTSFNAVTTITENNYNATISYGSDNQRAQMVLKQGTSTIMTRWYPTPGYIKETAASVTSEYTFIGGDCYSAPIVAITKSGTTTYYDILRDYLGNITHVVNASTGAVTAEYSFDAWGRMRNKSTWAYYAPGTEPALFIAGRGFTGHEHLPWFNLINMNGRVYDALIGSFLSPDNYVQNAGLTQNFNRYSYCINNPLSYNDPSGYNYMQLENMVYEDPIKTYDTGTSSGRWDNSLDGAPGFEENMASKGYTYVTNEYGIGAWIQNGAFQFGVSYQLPFGNNGKIVFKGHDLSTQKGQYSNFQLEIQVYSNDYLELNFCQQAKKTINGSYIWMHDSRGRTNGFYWDKSGSDYKSYTDDYYRQGAMEYFEDSPNYNGSSEFQITICGRTSKGWSPISSYSWGYYFDYKNNSLRYWFRPNNNLNPNQYDDLIETLDFENNNH